MAKKTKNTQAIGKWARLSRTSNQYSRIFLSAMSACVFAGQAHAIGLGEIDVQSSIGQPIRAAIALHGSDLHELEEHCLRGTLSLLDNTVRSSLKVGLRQSGNAMLLSLSGSRGIDEPAAVITVESQCGSRVVREYTVLLEPAPVPARPALAVAAARNEAAQAGPSEQPPRSSRHTGTPSARPLVAASSPQPPVRVRERASREPASVLRLSSASELPVVVPSDAGLLRLKLTNMLADPPPVAVAHVPARAEATQALLPVAYAAPVPLTDASEAHTAATSQADAVETPAAAGRISARADKGGAAIGSAFRTLSDQIAGALYFALIMAGSIWLVLRLRAMSQSTSGRWIPDIEPREAEKRILSERPDRAALPAEPPADSIKVWPGNAVNEPPELPVGDPAQRNTLPQAEEIMDVMEQVQFFLSIDDHANAVRLLEQLITDQGDTPGSPWPWLSLLDIYRKLGEQEEYERLRARFSQRYNGRVPHWSEAWEETEGLIALPHLRKRITQLWKTDKIVPFLERLLVDNRGGTRQGFDLSSFQDIRMLLEIAYTTHESKKYLKPALRTPQWSVAV
ncbi:MAG TPA: hypothetical protein VFF81_01400 [Noviherbaspirillum sp.]|nr:hypothetical protein [Noviherbaspirillum sp.]